MGKPEQFLWVVQTLMIRNAINLVRQSEKSDRYTHEISATGAYILCDEALRASELIPDHLSAAEAANQFFTYMASNLRDAQESATEVKMNVPAWFARG